jgi:ketosteroid isomerase-like protein
MDYPNILSKVFYLLLFNICGTVVIAQTRETEKRALNYLQQFRSDYVKSMLTSKYEGIQPYYADNVRLMPEFQKTVVGKNNALLYYQAFSKKFDIKSYDRKEVEVLDLGKRVVELGTFDMNIIAKETGKEYNVKGKYQNFWITEPNQEPILVTEAWNYNHSLEIENDLRFLEVPCVDVALQAHVPVTNNLSFELAALNRLMETAIIQSDAKLWAQFYSDDGMFIYSRHPIYEGRKALDAFLEKHIKEDMPIFEKLDIRNDEIVDLGDYVIEYASHIANWRNGEYSGVNTGKDIRIWRRGANCSLKIFRSMAMYD